MNESVDTYSIRFNNLKRLVDPGDNLPDDYEIRLFLNGLKPNIAARVAMADPSNLRAVVNEARATEAGTYYMRESPQFTNNDAIEALTKQMEQLSLNYANIVNVLAAQNGTPRATNTPSRNTNATTRANNDRKPFDKS
jgi:hypothetical protein